MPVPGCFLASFFHNGFNWFWLVFGLVSKYRVHGLGRFLAGCVFFCRSKLNLRVLWTIPFANIEIMQLKCKHFFDFDFFFLEEGVF